MGRQSEGRSIGPTFLRSGGEDSAPEKGPTAGTPRWLRQPVLLRTVAEGTERAGSPPMPRLHLGYCSGPARLGMAGRHRLPTLTREEEGRPFIALATWRVR